MFGSFDGNEPYEVEADLRRQLAQRDEQIKALKAERDECALGVMTASERAGTYANQIAALKAAKAKAGILWWSGTRTILTIHGFKTDGLDAYFAEEAGDCQQVAPRGQISTPPRGGFDGESEDEEAGDE